MPRTALRDCMLSLLLATGFGDPHDRSGLSAAPRASSGSRPTPSGPGCARRPLAAADAPIRTHDGDRVGHDGRVVLMDLVPGDLQQCADSAIRLRAEWLHSQGEPVMFPRHQRRSDALESLRGRRDPLREERPDRLEVRGLWHVRGLPGEGLHLGRDRLPGPARTPSRPRSPSPAMFSSRAGFRGMPLCCSTWRPRATRR